MKVGIVGCGGIGFRRAEAVSKIDDLELSVVADISLERAKKLANEFGCESTEDYNNVVNSDVDIIIISTTNDKLVEVAKAAIKNKKHVLIEKPAARNPKELKDLQDEAKDQEVKVKIGFNHRFHPAIMKAKEMVDQGLVGELMFIRARYGHGARKGYDKEWRAIPEISGGGEMLDQGSHIIDLSRWFLGDFSEAMGFSQTMFWDMEVEDNCFAILRTEKKQVAFLHASCTQWKNIFSFEIFGRTGQINIEGLGRSYGVETLKFYKMKPEFGIPDINIYEYPSDDDSWKKELEDFIKDIKEDRIPNGNLDDAMKTLKHVFEIYEWSKKNS